jgi:hypothetical protein
MKLELQFLASRRKVEKRLVVPVDDDYSFSCIEAMEADVRAEYALKMAVKESDQHWSQRITTDNPRGYTRRQLMHIAKASTLNSRMEMELVELHRRRLSEMKSSPNDSIMAHIDALEADVRAEYAAWIAVWESARNGELSDRYVLVLARLQPGYVRSIFIFHYFATVSLTSIVLIV